MKDHRDRGNERVFLGEEVTTALEEGSKLNKKLYNWQGNDIRD